MKPLVFAVGALLRLGVRCDRARLLRSAALMAVGFLATPLIALCLRSLTTAALAGQEGRAVGFGAVTAVLLVLELTMNHFAHLSYFELGELEEMSLQGELMALAHGDAGLDRLDQALYADRIALVREELPRTRSSLEAVLQLGGLAAQLVLTAVLLGLLDPWLLLLPPVALVPVLAGNAAQRRIDRAKEASAGHSRLAAHLLEVGTSPASVREARLCGAQEALIERHHRTWGEATGIQARAHARAGLTRALGQIAFATAYGGAIALVWRGAWEGRSGLGDVILVITLAAQVSFQVAGALTLLTTVQEAGRMLQRLYGRDDSAAGTRGADRGAAGDGGTRSAAGAETGAAGPGRDAGRVPAAPRRVRTAWAASAAADLRAARAAAAGVMRTGILLEDVSFTYPGAERSVLDGVSLDIPAGTALAVVGENGAGKSTLVKLLCGLYRPTGGRILVDGEDLAGTDPRAWQSRVATLFQDFARLQLRLRENVGIGELALLGEDDSLLRALHAAGCDQILGQVPGRLDGLLGREFGDGAELSGGQWQRLGLARTLLRRDPLLIALDEPASALDASAEHALFERFADLAAAGRNRSGAITLLVSHRFSTVRMADLILVLEQGRVAQVGTHAELAEADGLYAELYRIQARMYR
jgi:ATP-binding cassette subfamily B protein